LNLLAQSRPYTPFQPRRNQKEPEVIDLTIDDDEGIPVDDGPV
jgi:hypothetical protein